MSDIRLQAAPAVTVGLLVLAGLGLVMSQQSYSVASGAGTIWTGAALTVIAAVAAFAVNVPTGAKVALVIVAVVAVSSGFYAEHQLDQQRHRIEQILSTVP